MDKFAIIGLLCFICGGFLLLFALYYQNQGEYRTRFLIAQKPPPEEKILSTPITTLDPRYNRTLVIADMRLKIEIVDTPTTMSKGLSGRKELLDGSGMLFVFEEPQVVRFWMPDMYFPIDMFFIKSNRELANETQLYEPNTYSGLEGEVVFIHDNVPNPPLDTPKNELVYYSPPQPVDLVLEVPAGWAEKHNVRVGTTLHID